MKTESNIYIHSFTIRVLKIPKFHFDRAVIRDDDKSLVIKNVIPADEGIYICDAHNGVGQISAKAQLVVNCKLTSMETWHLFSVFFCLLFRINRLLLSH